VRRGLPADCEWFEARLIDLSAGRLQRERLDRLNSHARSCRSCGEMWAVSKEAPPRVVPDGDSFTRQVLARTSGVVCGSVPHRHGLNVEPRSWFREGWRAAFLRPRFSLEAAYVGALLLFSVLSLFPETPDSPRRVETLAGVPLRAGQQIGRLASAVPERWGGRLRTVGTELGGRSVDVIGRLEIFVENGSTFALVGAAEGSRMARAGLARFAEGAEGLTASARLRGLQLWERVTFLPNPIPPQVEE
jgi:hypothetical protein